MFFLLLNRVGELLRPDHLTGSEIEGVENHYPSTGSATAATALDLELPVSDVEFAMHGPAASKLDHEKLQSSP